MAQRNLFKAIFTLGLCAVLAGCVAQPTPRGAVQQLESFAEDLGLARYVADRCSSLRLVQSEEALLEAYLQQMLEAGYDPAAIAISPLAASRTVPAFRAIGRLINAGVDPERPESICAFGRAEIARGSRLGRLLR